MKDEWKVSRGRAFQGKKTHTKAWRQGRMGPFTALHMALYGWSVRFIGRGDSDGVAAGAGLVCHAKELGCP